MIFYYLVITGITIVYIYIILSFTIGWVRINNFRKGPYDPSLIYISLIVAARNEGKNISALLSSIAKQSLSKKYFEIILVDDNSPDHTLEIAKRSIPELPNLKIIRLNNTKGKKEAIQSGIKSAKGELIVTTDADCIHHEQWLETLAAFYISYKPKLIVAPVLMEAASFFENMQALDFFSLMVSGAGATGIKKPIMCNGANLAFEKETYQNIINPYKMEQVSGEDIFLLHAIKKLHPDKILFLKTLKTVVHTNAEKSFKKFIHQRKRWVSKSTAYNDSDIIITSIVVLTINLSIILSLTLAFFIEGIISAFIIQIILKTIVDFVFLYITSAFFKQRNLLKYFLPTQLFNLVMVPYLAIAGIFGTYKWKGRNFKHPLID